MNTYSVLGGQERLELRDQLISSFPIIQALIEGVQQGQIFRSTREDYWVLHKSGFSEVFLNDNDGNELIHFIIENDRLPKYFHIYNPPEELVDIFKTKSDIFNIRERSRIQLEYKGQQRKNNRSFLLEDEFSISEVTQDNFDLLDVFNLDLANKFWNSKDDFVRNALGVFIKNKENDPITICYAAAIVDQKAEIDVITNEYFRGKGFAKSVVNYFISKCNDRSIIPNWDCFSDNRPSFAIAKNLGFTERKFYNLISVYRK